MFSVATKNSKYKIYEYDKSLWLNVFIHDHSTKVNFVDQAEALHCNSQYKYSILDEINSRMRINHRYEFIMDFPYDNVFIRWEQSKNQVNELDGKPQADDFKMLDNNLPSAIAEFKGLTRSTIKADNIISCLLDCVPSSKVWCYAIGMYQNSHGTYKTDGIPTYKQNTKAIRLWIKIDPNYFSLRPKNAFVHFNLLFINILYIT